MRVRTSIHLVLTLVLATSVRGATDTPGFGIAYLETDGRLCVSVEGIELAPGDEVFVADFESRKIVRAIVVGRRMAICADASGFGDSSYDAVALEGEPPEYTLAAVAVLPPGAEAHGFEVRLQGEDQPLTFRRCASTEGVHFTAWKGPQRIWHAYDYVGYKLEPDCTEEEAEDK